MSVLTTAPIVWSRINLIKTFFLLIDVFAGSGLDADFSDEVEAGADGTFVGNWSSRKPCQMMLGGVLRTLKTTNLSKDW